MPEYRTQRVVDQRNVPINGAFVECLRVTYQSGRRWLSQAYGIPTNDLGEYRITGVSPGPYIIVAKYRVPLPPPPIRLEQLESSPASLESLTQGYQSTYFEGAPTPDVVKVLEIRRGADLRGIDLQMPAVRMASLRGRILSSNNEPIDRASAFLWQVDRAGRSLGPPMNLQLQGKDGTFTFSSLESGSYRLGVYGLLRDGAREEGWKSLRIQSVDAYETIQLSRAVDLTGSVSPEQLDVRISSLKVLLNGRLLGSRQIAEAGADRRFSFQGVPPEPLDVSVLTEQEEVYVKSIHLGTKELGAFSLEIPRDAATPKLKIVLSSAGGELRGTVEDSKRQPIQLATVALVPDEPFRNITRLYKSTKSDSLGKFILKGIAPGGYTLFGWLQVEPNSWTDPEVLRKTGPPGAHVVVEPHSKTDLRIQVAEASLPQ